MDINYQHIQVVGFDADDTLWVNETYFREAEAAFGNLLSSYETLNKIDQELYKTHIKNLAIYGYGVKGFVLSMVETAIEISNNAINAQTMQAILEIGKDMLEKPIELLEGVEEVLSQLALKYKLILATKGDLLDQERKLKNSGLLDFFHHIEVLSDKKEDNYSRLLNHLDIKPSQFLMIGNSLRSDVLPLLNIKAQAIHVPFHTTWVHEQVKDLETNGKSYKTVKNLKALPELLL
ncbi:HAD family hydrolase [Bizionia sediminis]|uniref:HAD family hydrolase n=1 Tax=Bizionia sediminis TaxID=1737064 RepID=A0ABW5KT01_9FLAO